MAHYVLIACVSQKGPESAPARELYRSTLFRKAYAYAESLEPDEIFTLSAKYGLVKSTQVIKPYDETLNTKPSAAIKAWSSKVLDQLARFADLENDVFTSLAGAKYRRFLTQGIKHCHVPLEGLSIGRQLHELGRLCNDN